MFKNKLLSIALRLLEVVALVISWKTLKWFLTQNQDPIQLTPHPVMIAIIFSASVLGIVVKAIVQAIFFRNRYSADFFGRSFFVTASSIVEALLLLLSGFCAFIIFMGIYLA